MCSRVNLLILDVGGAGLLILLWEETEKARGDVEAIINYYITPVPYLGG